MDNLFPVAFTDAALQKYYARKKLSPPQSRYFSRSPKDPSIGESTPHQAAGESQPGPKTTPHPYSRNSPSAPAELSRARLFRSSFAKRGARACMQIRPNFRARLAHDGGITHAAHTRAGDDHPQRSMHIIARLYMLIAERARSIIVPARTFARAFHRALRRYYGCTYDARRPCCQVSVLYGPAAMGVVDFGL